jgi:hypothetical protein
MTQPSSRPAKYEDILALPEHPVARRGSGAE